MLLPIPAGIELSTNGKNSADHDGRKTRSDQRRKSAPVVLEQIFQKRISPSTIVKAARPTKPV